MRLVIVVVLTVRRTLEVDGPVGGLLAGAKEGVWIVRLGAAEIVCAASWASNTRQHGICKIACVCAAISGRAVHKKSVRTSFLAALA